MNELSDRHMDRWMDGWINVWMEGWINEWMDRQIDRYMQEDRQIDVNGKVAILTHFFVIGLSYVS